MGLTVDQIDESSDDELFKLLGKELEERIAAERGTPEFVSEIRALPIGLRSMAATYDLDVSVALDDLGWHFGNWHNKELARETLFGLIELGASELAELFEQSFEIAQEFWEEIGAENWTDWYHGSPFEQRVDPLNTKAWSLLKGNDFGILKYWIEYARRHPERVGATELGD